MLARLCLALVEVLVAQRSCPAGLAVASVAVHTIPAFAIHTLTGQAFVDVLLTDGAGEACWTVALELVTWVRTVATILAFRLVTKNTFSHEDVVAALLKFKLLPSCGIDQLIFCEEGEKDTTNPHLLHASTEEVRMSSISSICSTADNNFCIVDKVSKGDLVGILLKFFFFVINLDNDFDSFSDCHGHRVPVAVIKVASEGEVAPKGEEVSPRRQNHLQAAVVAANHTQHHLPAINSCHTEQWTTYLAAKRGRN